MLEKNENIINSDEVVETAPVYNETVKKKRNIVVSIILIMVAILLCVGAYFGISAYRHNSIIEKVKSSTLGGYSKTVEEAFNECFGKENLEWSYEDKSVNVRIPRFAEMLIDEIVADNENFTVIDLGNRVKSSYRYMYITGWRIDFEYNYNKKEVSDVILSTGFVKFNKNEKCKPVLHMSLLNAENDSLDKLILHGIFKEDLDVYKSTIKGIEENDKKQKAKESKMRTLLEGLKEKNVSNDTIAEVRTLLLDEYLATYEKAEKMTVKEMTELLQTYIDICSERIDSDEVKSMRETTARLAATSPYRTE